MYEVLYNLGVTVLGGQMKSRETLAVGFVDDMCSLGALQQTFTCIQTTITVKDIAQEFVNGVTNIQNYIFKDAVWEIIHTPPPFLMPSMPCPDARGFLHAFNYGAPKGT